MIYKSSFALFYRTKNKKILAQGNNITVKYIKKLHLGY